MKYTMNVQIIKKETIRPSSPTPPHLRTYSLSLIDQVAPCMYIPLVLFYQNVSGSDNFSHFYQTITKSLSETLTLFPPLAGKIKDNVSVDCNDDGVDCYETRVDCFLDELLARPDIEYLKRLLAVDNTSKEDKEVITGGQIYVQINLFKCGGVALGLSFSHKLIDASSICYFLKCWSAKTINSGDVVMPDLTVSSNMPGKKDVSLIGPDHHFSPPKDDYTTARLVFYGPNIAALKEKSASPNLPQPTRVEALTALIWKCAMSASKINKKNCAMPYFVGHVVNLRKKLAPSSPEAAFGNIYGYYVAMSEQSDEKLEALTDKLRKGLVGYRDSIAKTEQVVDMYVEWTAMMQAQSFQNNPFTSWCRYPFYEADYGLGTPIWVGLAVSLDKKINSFMDAKDGKGIEAYVSLSKEDMDLFLCDPLLLEYASVNPSI